MGQGVGSAATWLAKPWGVDTMVRGTASVGLVEREAMPLGFQWGAGLNGTVSKAVQRFRLEGSYGLNYARNGVTLQGWTLWQQARANVWASLTDDLASSLQFQATAARRKDVLLGDGYTRDVLVLGEARWRAHTLTISAGLSDGLPPTLTVPGGGDGLFISPQFNTHSRYLTAGYQGQFFDGLLGSALIGRLASVEAEGQPSRAEQAVFAQLWYVIGRITLSAEYRLELNLTENGWSRSQTFFARASRSFNFL